MDSWTGLDGAEAALNPKREKTLVTSAGNLVNFSAATRAGEDRQSREASNPAKQHRQRPALRPQGLRINCQPVPGHHRKHFGFTFGHAQRLHSLVHGSLDASREPVQVSHRQEANAASGEWQQKKAEPLCPTTTSCALQLLQASAFG
jgi:hypothetical protein